MDSLHYPTVIASHLIVYPRSNPDAPASPPPSPMIANGAEKSNYYSPIWTKLSDSDSVLLPVHTLPSYLEAALKVLGLHTEARTSFITLVNSQHHPSTHSYYFRIGSGYLRFSNTNI